MDAAWEAVAAGNLVLAERISRRAVDAGHVNPRIWNDRGQILRECRQLDEAEEALRTAIALAPTYAEAFANLAALQAARGKFVQAERLQRRAVELEPDAAAEAVLRSYGAMVPPIDVDGMAAGDGEPEPFTERTNRYDWDALTAELRRFGVVRLPGLLDAAECTAIIALDEAPSRFEHEVEHDSEEFGRVRYRFFQPPLPELVEALRRELYGRAARIVNAWSAELGRGDRVPATLAEFLAHCHRAGQHRSTPILVRYERGGGDAPHRDAAGRVVFPLQLAVTLGPGGGGEFVLYDDRPGKKVRRRSVATQPGDGVLFCCAERLVEVGGAVGLQPVRHGVAAGRDAVRYALGVPFHEHG